MTMLKLQETNITPDFGEVSLRLQETDETPDFDIPEFKDEFVETKPAPATFEQAVVQEPALGTRPTISGDAISPQPQDLADIGASSIVRIEPIEVDFTGAPIEVGKLIYDIPVNTVGAFASLFEDDNPEAEHDWKDIARTAQTERNKQRMAEEGGESYVLPFLQAKDIREAAASTGFSGVAMGAGALGATPALLPVPGARVAGVTGALSASGTAAYKMDKAMFTQQLIDVYRQDMKQTSGEEPTPEEIEQLVQKTKGLRTKHALWEAIPEAAGNVAQLSGIGAIFKAALGKKLGAKIFQSLAGMYGVELGTETITQTGQHNVEIEAGVTKGKTRKFTSFEDMQESLKEVGPATFILVSLTGGGAVVGTKTYQLIANPKDTNTAAIVNPIIKQFNNGEITLEDAVSAVNESDLSDKVKAEAARMLGESGQSKADRKTKMIAQIKDDISSGRETRETIQEVFESGVLDEYGITKEELDSTILEVPEGLKLVKTDEKPDFAPLEKVYKEEPAVKVALKEPTISGREAQKFEMEILLEKYDPATPEETGDVKVAKRRVELQKSIRGLPLTAKESAKILAAIPETELEKKIKARKQRQTELEEAFTKEEKDQRLGELKTAIKGAPLTAEESAKILAAMPETELEKRLAKKEELKEAFKDEEFAPEVTEKEKPAEPKTEQLKEAEKETDAKPSEAKKDAGNYAKGKVRLHGYEVSIENPSGSTRSGTDATGKKWSIKMADTYGYLKGTVGRDKDHLDVFVNPKNPESDKIYIVDQVNKDGSMDEHKIIFGRNSEAEARKAYLSNYEKGWTGLGSITEMTTDEFKKWTKGDTTKPVSLGKVDIAEAKKKLRRAEVAGRDRKIKVAKQELKALKPIPAKIDEKTPLKDEKVEAKKPTVIAKPIRVREKVTEAQKLTDAVGKPEQLETLKRMGITDKEGQIEHIVRDAVTQKVDVAEALEARGKTEAAEALRKEAIGNGKKLKDADGLITERKVDEALSGVVAEVKKETPAEAERKFYEKLGIKKKEPVAPAEERISTYDKKDAKWHGLDTENRSGLLKIAKQVELKYKIGEPGLTKEVLIHDILEKINAGSKPEYMVDTTEEFDWGQPVTAEDGRAYILEDLASAVYKSGQSLADFTSGLKKKLGKAFSKVKAKVKRMYDVMSRVTTGREVGAIGDIVPPITQSAADKIINKFNDEHGTSLVYQGPQMFKGEVLFHTVTDLAPVDESPTSGSTINISEEFTYESLAKNHDRKVREFEAAETKEEQAPRDVRPLVKKALTKRNVKGDDLLNSMDLFDDLVDRGGVISNDGIVTLYHRTNKESAEKIKSTGKMVSKEDRLFFGTKKTGQIEGYGSDFVTVGIPLENLELNDVFTDEAHVTMLSGKPGTVNSVDVKPKVKHADPTDPRILYDITSVPVLAAKEIAKLVKAISKTKTFRKARTNLRRLSIETYKKGMGFREFSRSMSDALGKTWKRFSEKGRELYEYAKINIGKVVTGKEVGAIGDVKEPTRAAIQKKALKMQDKYEGLVEKLRDNATDTYRKQVELTKYIRSTLPIVERGRVITEIKNLARPKTIETRQKYFDKAIKKIDEAWERYEVKKTIGKINKLIKAIGPKKLKGKPVGKFTKEIQRELNAIEQHLTMDKKEATEKIGEILGNADTAQREPSPAELEDIYYLSFANIDNSSIETAQRILEDIETLIDTGKTIHALREFNRQERMRILRDNAMEDFTGGKGLKPREVMQAEEAGRQRTIRGLPARWRRTLSGFDTIHQSFEWLLDKVTHGKSATLKGKTTDYFSGLAHDATHKEGSSTINQYKAIQDKAAEIFGKKGRKLSTILNENTRIDTNSGVTYASAVDGERVDLPMSQNQAYKLWQWLEDPSLFNDFAAHGYDAQTKTELESFIKPEVRRWAEWQMEEFYPSYYEGINDTYGKMFYVDLPYNPYYTPLFREYEGKDEKDDPLLSNQSHYGTVMSGHFKGRVENKKLPKLMDGDQVMMRHIVEMEHFKAWAEPIREMRSVLGNEKVQKAIRQYDPGAAANDALNNFINNFASGGVDRSVQLGLLDAARSNFVSSVLGLNPVVFIKQLTSIPAYAMDVPVDEFAKGITHFMAHPIEATKTLAESDMMQARYGLGFERDIALALHRGAPARFSGMNTWADAMMAMTKFGDKGAILIGGWASYRYNLKKNLKTMGKKEAHEKALREFERTTERSQQAAGIKDLAKIQRAYGSFGKLFTMFMTSPTSYYRQIAGGWRNLAKGRGSKRENLKRIAIAQFVLPAIFQFVASGMRWDDDDQIRAALLGPVNGLFMIRDLLNAGVYAFTKGKVPFSAGLTPLSMTVSSMGRIGKRIGDMVDAGEITIDDMIKVADEMMRGPAKLLTKIPYDPVKRQVKGVIAAIKGDTEHPIRRSIGYSEKALTPRKEKSTTSKSRIRRLQDYQ